MELPQVYAPALKPQQVISLFYSTNMPMETIAEFHFDEQGTMVLYPLFVHTTDYSISKKWKFKSDLGCENDAALLTYTFIQ